MSYNKDVAENQLLLPTGKIITFNDQQFDGLKNINKWLSERNNENFFTLAGFAGTGKTSIVKKTLDEYRGGVVVSAPTHKAKRVVMKTTKRIGQTLHSLLGLRPDVNLDDFNPNNPIFNPIAIPRINDYNLVVIDEASMINQELYNLINEQVEKSGTNVLYMGDPAQIPPVGEKESVVFLQNQKNKLFHQLTKIERQSNSNPLMFIYDEIRNNLTKPNIEFERRTKLNDFGEGVIFLLNKKEFRKAILECYSRSEFKTDTDFCKVIAWRNDTVMAANKIIRKRLLEKTSDVVEVGDLLMGYRTISSKGFRYNIIENSADYRVVSKSKIEENEYGILGFNVKIVEILDDNKRSYEDIFIVDANNHQNLHMYAQTHDFFKDKGMKNKKMWKKYYEFRRKNILMKTIDKYLNGVYRDERNIIAKDMDYAYAITAHKAQGSTYSHVFVIENDINHNPLIKERNQIKYVALTRPSKTATILTTKIDM